MGRYPVHRHRLPSNSRSQLPLADRPSLETRAQGHDEAGSTKAALTRSVLVERLGERIPSRIQPFKSFDGGDLRVMQQGQRQQTRGRRSDDSILRILAPPTDDDRTRPASTFPTNFLGAHEPLVAQIRQEVVIKAPRSRRDHVLARIDGESQLVHGTPTLDGGRPRSKTPETYGAWFTVTNELVTVNQAPYVSVPTHR